MSGLSLNSLILQSVGFADTSASEAPPVPEYGDREWDEPLPDGTRPPATEGQRRREDRRWHASLVNADLGVEARRLERFEQTVALPLTAQHLAPVGRVTDAGDAPTVPASRLAPVSV